MCPEDCTASGKSTESEGQNACSTGPVWLTRTDLSPSPSAGTCSVHEQTARKTRAVVTAENASVIGGLGSLPGTVLAALFIGLSDGSISVFCSPTLAKILATLLVAFVLVFRPQGLFGARPA